MRRSPERGFTLIETLVSILISTAILVGIGLLGERLIGHRVTGASNWDAVRLAERQIENLRALPSPSTQPDLSAGLHGPFSVSMLGQPSIGGPYRIRWTVIDDQPHTGSKRVTVTVDHANGPRVAVDLVTYYVVK